MAGSLGPSAGLPGIKAISASKALMSLNRLKGDDIGMLRFTRTSEFGTRVKCTNHAHDVASTKQVNLWHRDQRNAVAKLARGQQKMFRNLIKVQNEKRRIQRQALIRKQREIQLQLWKQSVREREEAQIMLRNLIIMTERGDMDGRTMSSSTGQLDEICEEPGAGGDPLRCVGSPSDRGFEAHSSRNSPNDAGRKSSPTPPLSSTRTSHILIPQGEDVTNKNCNVDNVSEAATAADEPSIRHQPRTEPAVLNEGNKKPRYGRVTKPHLSRESKQSHRFQTAEIASKNGKPSLPDVIKNMNPNEVLPDIKSKPRRNSSMTNACEVFDDGESLTSRQIQVDEKGPTLKSKRRERKVRKAAVDSGSSSSETISQKYHIGIANRNFRLPDYHPPPVTSVVRYDRNSQGRLTPNEVSVKPASEEYKLPSRRSEYMVEKALVWERGREAVREKKLKGFNDRMKEIERIEKMDPRLGTSLREPFRRNSHLPLHGQDPRLPSGSNRSEKVQQAPGQQQSLETYHLRRDVNDPRNCRYLRLNHLREDGEGEPGFDEAGGDGGVQLTGGNGRNRGRRMSSWGLVGIPPHQMAARQLQDTRHHHHSNVIF